MKKWDIVKSSVVHKNKYFSLVEEIFCLDSGETGKYFMIKKPDFVSVVAIEDDSVYFIEMYRYTLRRKIWEIPMGGIEEGESPMVAARRELREETGILAKKMKRIGYSESFKGQSDQRFHTYIAEGLSFGAQDLDEMEKESSVKLLKLKISEVPDLIRSGKITDSHTIASFSLFMLNYKGSK
ncbi:MAG: NUDIX hydrolase [Candidatus Paceibacterota bacterium]